MTPEEFQKIQKRNFRPFRSHGELTMLAFAIVAAQYIHFLSQAIIWSIYEQQRSWSSNSFAIHCLSWSWLDDRLWGFQVEQFFLLAKLCHPPQNFVFRTVRAASEIFYPPPEYPFLLKNMLRVRNVGPFWKPLNFALHSHLNYANERIMIEKSTRQNEQTSICQEEVTSQVDQPKSSFHNYSL